MQPTLFFRLLVVSTSLILCPLKNACSQPAAPVAVMDAKHALEGLPKEISKGLKEGSPDLDKAVKEASQFVKSKIDKKTASVSFKIKTVDQTGKHITLISTLDEERVAGTAYVVEHTIMLDQSQHGLAAKFKAGARVKATGEVYGFVYRQGSKPKLVIEMYKPVFD